MEKENMVQDESSSQEYEGEGQYSEEEVDRIADTAIEAIQDILKYFNVGEVTIEAVSYTHLDVYKRQILPSSALIYTPARIESVERVEDPLTTTARAF